MERWDGLKNRIQTASGRKKAELVLKNGWVVNVFTEELERADVAIAGGMIVGLGNYEGEQTVDVSGSFICPGFLDGHIHLESSMIIPAEFERAVLPHGTTGVVTDPHELANVAGTQGIEYILAATADLRMDVFVMLPSCVPAAGLDESGAVLAAGQLEPFYRHERVLGLAELMNSYGTVQGDESIMKKILAADGAGKIINGHAPGLQGKQLNAYVAAGVGDDHECSGAEEALAKLERGQWIMIREGTAAKNLEALISLCRAPYYQRCMFVTDDRHPGELIKMGHMDYIIRKAISLGADPIQAIKMATLNPAQYFRLAKRGAVAPGYRADLVVLSDLEQVTVTQVYKDGKLAADQCGVTETKGQERTESEKALYPRIYQSFHLPEVTKEQLQVVPQGNLVRVICLTPYGLLTTERTIAWTEIPGYAPGVDVNQDVVKIAVLERHHDTGHIGLGFLGGYGLKAGAVAASIAHDSHNLMIAGTNDTDMVLAANTVRRNQGGLAVVRDGKVLGELPLPVAGLMSLEPAGEVGNKLDGLKAITRELGIPEAIDPFMTLAFTSLPVIPKLRLNTCGLIDTEKQEVIPVTYKI